jgi:hypothetical protein
MNLYNTNFQTLAQMLNLVVLRPAEKLTVLLSSLMAPFVGNLALFVSFRQLKITQMSYNSQVCYLRKLLNDLYDPDDRRIIIEDSDTIAHVFLNARLDDEPIMLNERDEDDPLMLSDRNDLVYGQGFIVQVPDSLNGFDLQIKQSLNDYKLVTKFYTIIYFT